LEKQLIEELFHWEGGAFIATKTCNKCNRELPIGKFSKECGNKIRSHCRECDKKVMKVRAHLRKITPPPGPDYRCPVCNRTESQIKEKMQYLTRKVPVWSCDHNHETDEFRAWMCNKCNLGLGNFNDDPKLLHNAIDYLEGRWNG
jgi:hypothetical protein